MGGINGVPKRKRAADMFPTAPSDVIGTKHAQPNAFRATGKGFFNRLPDLSADAANANGSITNRATTQTPLDFYKLYLFINAVQTGWALAGEHGQGQLGRVFYPRNLSQDELIIEGITANQYEYDKVVQFVEHHHYTQFTSKIAVEQALAGGNSYLAVDFLLHRPTVRKHTFDAFQPLKYSIAITDMQAGAERFKFAREYTLQCKVLYDYLAKDELVEREIDLRRTRQQIFGAADNPSPRTGAETPTTQARKVKARFNHRD